MMKRGILFTIKVVLLLTISTLSGQGLEINHNHVNVDIIPDSVISYIKNNSRIIHGHLSHGWQIDDGMDSLELSYENMQVEVGNYELPNIDNTLNIMYYYSAYGDYWYDNGPVTLRNYFSKYPEINIAIFSWCRDMDEQNSDFVQAYLDTLSKLEREFPNISFIYSTGNAQSNGDIGLLRYNNNTIIREYCRANNKILYDFADLDCWWYNPGTQIWEYSSYEINGVTVPVEHPQFHIEEWHHTTVESGIQKAKAMWYLLANLAGWKDDGGGDEVVAINDTVTIIEDSQVSIDALANDYTSQGGIDPSSVVIIQAPLNGQIEQINQQTGVITYKPNPNYNGTEFFTYKFRNDNGYLSNEAQVLINISPVNDPPQKFRLIHPSMNDTIEILDNVVAFLWRKAADVDNNELVYDLYISSVAKDTFIADIVDTSFSFYNAGFFENGKDYEWFVNTKDDEFTISSSDTFKFFISLVSSIEDKHGDVPISYNLAQNYPNPFNPETFIPFSLPTPGNVEIYILDVSGRVIEKIFDEYKMSGNYRIKFNGGKLASGIYLYKIKIGNKFVQTKKMLLIK